MNVPRGLRLLPLTTSVLALLGLPGATVQAAGVTHEVTTCADGGAGSLRNVIAAAASGDTVDYSGLSNCSISLTTGAIPIVQADLAIVGNPDVPIDGTGNTPGKRLFLHTGGGTVAFSHVVMGNNTLETVVLPFGGCLASKGSVAMYHSEVSHCLVHAIGPAGAGGAIRAYGNVKLVDTKITSSQVNPGTKGFSYGGAVYAGDGLDLDGATIADNFADHDLVGYGFGGAVVARGDVTIAHSTISANHASGAGGGVFILSGGQFGMHESTVSGNRAARGSGVVVNDVPDVRIDNSTVAFNASTAGNLYASGLAVFGLTTNIGVTLRSSLISNNYDGASERDLTISAPYYSAALDASSGHDLIRAADDGTPVPADTQTACPHLAPLRDNGGAVPTHALNSGSPAIDTGANPDADPYDARNLPAYLRESPTGLADIGAYEVDQGDVVFTADNEGCAPLPGG